MRLAGEARAHDLSRSEGTRRGNGPLAPRHAEDVHGPCRRETGGRLTAWEELLPQRSSPPLHVHHDEDEAWFVLDGSLTFQVADSTWTADTGSFVWAPRGLPHTFRVDSPTARMLALAVPGRFDRFVRATGRPADAPTLPPPPEGPPDLAGLVAAAREHGMEILGPPLS